MVQYENDEQAVKRAIADAAAEIDHGTARTIASWFNDGANTVIYAFVSTGAMVGDTFPTDVLLHEIRKGLDPATERANEYALEALEAYCNEREAYDDLDRVEGWSDMSVPKHVDYPHESGRLVDCPECEAGCPVRPGVGCPDDAEPCVYCAEQADAFGPQGA